MACYRDEAVLEDPTFGGVVEGRAAIQEAFGEFFFSGVTQLRFREWDSGPGGGAVQWEWAAHGTLRQLGVFDRVPVAGSRLS